MTNCNLGNEHGEDGVENGFQVSEEVVGSDID